MLHLDKLRAFTALAFGLVLGASAPLEARQRAPLLAPADRVWTIEGSIEAEEYRFAPVEEETWSAPNRRQGLRSRITCEGLTLFPRASAADGEGAPWRLALRSRAFGRAGTLRALGKARALEGAGGRVELEHGLLREWFTNEPRGLQQGWTIERLPEGQGALVLELEARGLAPRVGADRRSVAFSDAAGEVLLRYEGLFAFDASGTELEARFEPAREGFAWVVEVEGAQAPITVDPWFRGPTWSASGNQGQAFYGLSVAGAGDVNGDGFDDLIIGAPFFDAGQSDEGRAFLYLGSASGPSLAASWTGESNQSGANFGTCVAAAGDVNGDGFGDVLVGAHEYDQTVLGEGRAYLFLGSASGLSAAPAWTYAGGETIVALGWSLACAGDVNGDGFDDLIVAAPYWHNPIGDEGAAFVFHGGPSGPSLTPDWSTEGEQTTAVLGRSVAGAGDVNGDGFADVIVGANLYNNGQNDEGRAFVFHGSPSGLSPSADWSAESDVPNAWFGVSVAGAGDVDGDGFSDVIVGAPNLTNGQTREGRVYLFTGSAGGLGASALWTYESNQANAYLGTCVSGAGDVNADGHADLLVGAWGYDGALLDEGVAALFLGSPSGPGAAPDWTALGGQAGAYLGYSLAGAGDLDGDGIADIVLGLPLWDGGFQNEGRALVHLGLGFRDCNGNGVDDDLDLAQGTSSDCNHNGIPDECDLADGTSQDQDGDGTPDECRCDVQAYCLAAPSSADPGGARISMSGSASLFRNDLVLWAAPLPANRSGLFFFGPAPEQVPFGNGWRCVGTPIRRFPVIPTGSGAVSYAVDNQSGPAERFQAGVRSYVQFWYRDPAGGGAFFNTSDALAILFCH